MRREGVGCPVSGWRAVVCVGPRRRGDAQGGLDRIGERGMEAGRTGAVALGAGIITEKSTIN